MKAIESENCIELRGLRESICFRPGLRKRDEHLVSTTLLDTCRLERLWEADNCLRELWGRDADMYIPIAIYVRCDLRRRDGGHLVDLRFIDVAPQFV